MKKTLFIDFETRSECDLKDCGAHRYAQHPSTEVILVSWAVDGDPVHVDTGVSEGLMNMIESSRYFKVAHNAEFEMAISKYLLGIGITLEDWHDTAYQAAYFSYPRSLDKLAGMLRTRAKGSPEEMLFFSKPLEFAAPPKADELFSKATVTRYNEMKDFPDKAETFVLYSRTDTEVLREVYSRMPELPEIEKFSMLITFQMNFNGVRFDMDLANKIQQRAKQYSEEAARAALEKYSIVNIRSPKQVKEALYKVGVYLDSIRAEERNGKTHEILDLYDESSGSSFAKINKARERICNDDRLHGEFVGNGAHTGRWAGRGVQMQNFKRVTHPKGTSTDLSAVESYEHLKQHMRLCVTASKGRSFVCADLSQIEARVVAWLSGCEWRLKLFAEGGDLYSRSAERMFNVQNVTKDSPYRQIGKCSELGLGYGGGHMAIYKTNRKFYNEQGEDKIVDIVKKWRDNNPEVCQLWRDLEGAWREATKRGVCKFTSAGGVNITYTFDGATMRIMLPSGRALYYRGVQMIPAPNSYPQIVYLSYESGYAKSNNIWGGTITENVVQAIAKDVLVDIIRRMHEDDKKSKITGSVHDEVWYDVLNGKATYEKLLEEMSKPISWAQGLITKGEGFYADRYIK